MVEKEAGKLVFGNGKKKGKATYEPFGYETLDYSKMVGIVNKYDFGTFYKNVGVDTQNSTHGLLVLFGIKHEKEFAEFAKGLQSGEIPLAECRHEAGRDGELGPNGTKAQVATPEEEAQE